MFVDRVDGLEKYSAANIIGIRPSDWESIKMNTDLFDNAGHVIESHLISFMRRFGRLGILTDDTMERTWIDDHKWEHTYACVLNWQTRSELKFARLQAEKEPAVQDAAAKGKAPTKRSKKEIAIPATSFKSYTDVYEYILTLEDTYPFRSILGNSKDREEVDLIYDDIDDEVEKDIDLAARNL